MEKADDEDLLAWTDHQHGSDGAVVTFGMGLLDICHFPCLFSLSRSDFQEIFEGPAVHTVNIAERTGFLPHGEPGEGQDL